MKNRDFVQRLGYATHGILVAFKRERSMQTHGLAVLGVSAFLALTGATALWWAIIALSIGLVLVAELLNTAIEALADRLHPEHHPEIGVAKDVAAGAVLIATIVAILAGIAYLLR